MYIQYGLAEKQIVKGLITTAYDHLADVYDSIAAGIGIALLNDRYPIPYAAYDDPLA